MTLLEVIEMLETAERYLAWCAVVIAPLAFVTSIARVLAAFSSGEYDELVDAALTAVVMVGVFVVMLRLARGQAI